MSGLLYRVDPYQGSAEAEVIAHTQEGGVVLSQTVFYPTGGGQPGDSGQLIWPGGVLNVATTVRDRHVAGRIALVPDAPRPLPAIGTTVLQKLDWTRRYRHMRLHTALHLLSVVIPLPVTGGAIGADKARLDFDMPEMPGDIAPIEAALNAMVDRDLPVNEDWITQAQLRARPELVKTMSVWPPESAGPLRLVRIGQGRDLVDQQPCGGTHVARLGEIGRLRLGRIEKKGRQNRRVYLHLDA